MGSRCAALPAIAEENTNSLGEKEASGDPASELTSIAAR